MKINKVGKKILLGLLTVTFLLGLVTYFYVNDYYRASGDVVDLLVQYENRIMVDGKLTHVMAKESLEFDHEPTGLVFYPGGKVEANSYLPLLVQISDLGIDCFMVEMPGNLAVFNTKAADNVLDKFPEIQSWYLSGHSLGGAMASGYLEKNHEKFEGLILLGAYPINEAPLKTLVIYGTHDIKLDLEKVGLADEVFEIVDGNHAYFGNYGEQEGDGQAKISRASQQEQTVELIKKMILWDNHR